MADVTVDGELIAMIKKSIVRSLREFGYPDCNHENVFTDYVYRKFARSQLQDVVDVAPLSTKGRTCQKLIDMIDALEKSPPNENR